MTWQKIDTAPKDGSVFLSCRFGLFRKYLVSTAFWRDKGSESYFKADFGEPTHWMPLPEPPKEGEL